MLSIIVAIARGGAIGRGGDQPFYIREDLRRFRALTTGHPVIMGRRTFEALPKGALPNRRNIVITRNKDYVASGAETVPSIEDALTLVAAQEAFVIGGGEIYRHALPLADSLYITEIDSDVNDADTFFPPIDPSTWELAEASPPMRDDPSAVDFRFLHYIRRH